VTSGRECETGSKGSDDSDPSNAGATTWVKSRQKAYMGQFTGNSGVKQIPLGSTKVSDVKELLFGDSFFGMLCQEN
jgi:hypothetical protein